jgi:hypothetical protein
MKNSILTIKRIKLGSYKEPSDIQKDVIDAEMLKFPGNIQKNIMSKNFLQVHRFSQSISCQVMSMTIFLSSFEFISITNKSLYVLKSNARRQKEFFYSPP